MIRRCFGFLTHRSDAVRNAAAQVLLHLVLNDWVSLSRNTYFLMIVQLCKFQTHTGVHENALQTLHLHLCRNKWEVSTLSSYRSIKILQIIVSNLLSSSLDVLTYTIEILLEVIHDYHAMGDMAASLRTQDGSNVLRRLVLGRKRIHAQRLVSSKLMAVLDKAIIMSLQVTCQLESLEELRQIRADSKGLSLWRPTHVHHRIRRTIKMSTKVAVPRPNVVAENDGSSASVESKPRRLSIVPLAESAAHRSSRYISSALSSMHRFSLQRNSAFVSRAFDCKVDTENGETQIQFHRDVIDALDEILDLM